MGEDGEEPWGQRDLLSFLYTEQMPIAAIHREGNTELWERKPKGDME